MSSLSHFHLPPVKTWGPPVIFIFLLPPPLLFPHLSLSPLASISLDLVPDDNVRRDRGLLLLLLLRYSTPGGAITLIEHLDRLNPREKEQGGPGRSTLRAARDSRCSAACSTGTRPGRRAPRRGGALSRPLEEGNRTSVSALAARAKLVKAAMVIVGWRRGRAQLKQRASDVRRSSKMTPDHLPLQRAVN